MRTEFRSATLARTRPESTGVQEKEFYIQFNPTAVRVFPFLTHRYYRVLKSLDMANSEQRQRVLDMLGESVFKTAPG